MILSLRAELIRQIAAENIWISLIKVTEGKLSLKKSDWYHKTAMESHKDYNEFCENFFECKEDKYNAIKSYEFVYLLEKREGCILSPEILLYDAKI